MYHTRSRRTSKKESEKEFVERMQAYGAILSGKKRHHKTKKKVEEEEKERDVQVELPLKKNKQTRETWQTPYSKKKTLPFTMAENRGIVFLLGFKITYECVPNSMCIYVTYIDEGYKRLPIVSNYASDKLEHVMDNFVVCKFDFAQHEDQKELTKCVCFRDILLPCFMSIHKGDIRTASSHYDTWWRKASRK